MTTKFRLPVLREAKDEKTVVGRSSAADRISNLLSRSKSAISKVMESFSANDKAASAIPVNPKYQSLSITVPGGCPNACKFCVSDMHEEKGIPNLLKDQKKREELKRDVLDRLVWAKEKGTDTLVLTGSSSEPVVHVAFLKYIKEINEALPSPFRRIEIQTSGAELTDERLQFLKEMRVKTVALSLSSLDSDENSEINRTPNKLKVDIGSLSGRIRDMGFNLRLCINLNGAFDKFFDAGMESFFDRCIKLGANQLTFRNLFTSGKGSGQDQWIESHKFDPELLTQLFRYIKTEGTAKDRLPFGAIVYTIKQSIATIVDDDCMNSAGPQASGMQKYCILREDGKLYYDWADAGTLIL